MKKTALVIAGVFVSGVALGANRSLLKFMNPALKAGGKGIVKTYNSLLKFIVRRKEYIEDLVAAARM